MEILEGKPTLNEVERSRELKTAASGGQLDYAEALRKLESEVEILKKRLDEQKK
jgi:hypothetical protein